MRAGEALQLQCLAHGTPPLTFQWSRVGGSLPGRVTARNEMLHFESVAPEDSGRYRCQVTNKVGSAEAFTLVLVQGEQPSSGWAERVSFPPGPLLTQQLAPRDPHLGHLDLPLSPHLEIPPFPVLYNLKTPSLSSQHLQLSRLHPSTGIDLTLPRAVYINPPDFTYQAGAAQGRAWA